MKRKQEIHDMLMICDKIKKYITDNKSDLLKQKGDDEKKIS